jgi:type I restriction enzyme R subunit
MDSEVIRRRDLPHWDVPDAAYFVTTCLHDSIPSHGLLEISRFRTESEKIARPESMTVAEWKVHCWKKTFVRMEAWLDRRPANRCLENPELAEIIVKSMRHFAEERYDLHAYVVMPSHIHWVFQPRRKWVESLDTKDGRTPRERIVYSLNRFTSRNCNKHLNQVGEFWQHESFDHWVRDLDELDRILRYIEENPVKAGLVKTPEEWRFSSAWLRKSLGLEWGVPLPRLRS